MGKYRPSGREGGKDRRRAAEQRESAYWAAARNQEWEEEQRALQERDARMARIAERLDKRTPEERAEAFRVDRERRKAEWQRKKREMGR